MNFENELNKIKQSIAGTKLNENPVKFSELTINHLYFIDEDTTEVNSNGTLSKKYSISHRIALESRSDGKCYINPSDMVKVLSEALKQAKGKHHIIFSTRVLYDSDNNQRNQQELTEVMNSENLTINQPKEYKKIFELIKKLRNE
ncbi:MAG: hypothetical protein ACE364_00545 [Chlorobiota bacterium]